MHTWTSDSQKEPDIIPKPPENDSTSKHGRVPQEKTTRSASGHGPSAADRDASSDVKRSVTTGLTSPELTTQRDNATLSRSIPLLVIDAQDARDVSRKSFASETSPFKSLFVQLPNEIIIHILAELAPSDLDSISLVSHKFHELLTSRHAWMNAFARYFPTADLPYTSSKARIDTPILRRRTFARLTPQATWRSEYTLRTRLLRALARGKPIQSSSPISPRSPQPAPTPINHYNSRLASTVTHLDANFDQEHVGKRPLRFLHGASGTTTKSDPLTGRVDIFGMHPIPPSELEGPFRGEAMYGLGRGEIVVVPHPMDISLQYGHVAGTGHASGSLFYTPPDEAHGYHLSTLTECRAPELGIPRIPSLPEIPQWRTSATTSVWIAKNPTIPSLSQNVVMLMTGSSIGVLTCYDVSPGLSQDRRRTISVRWVLSPGVPIISIIVDEHYSAAREKAGRIWAVVLNALGEVFILSKFPQRFERVKGTGGVHAWKSGRSVYWDSVEATRRKSRPNPYSDTSSADASSSPRSSWDGMGLSPTQLTSETLEMEDYMNRPPRIFRSTCIGWDMQRRLEVDFAGGHDGACEFIVVVDTGQAEDCSVDLTRYTRYLVSGSQGDQQSVYEWRTTKLGLEGVRSSITASALDNSLCSTMTCDEDPLVQASKTGGTHDANIPGQRGRYLSVGTSTGVVMLWDIRAVVAATARILPIRIIHTDSPEISCLAVSALYVIHGGSDGLVQAWDPLGSTLLPVRTFHSRFSSRARRRLLQAQASPQGVGENMWAAGAICIDPDPTVLRGMVSVGAFLRFWNFRSSAADQHRTSKRRQRRTERGGNVGADRVLVSARADVKKFMENERAELRADGERREREAARLAGRYGTELLVNDASEEELLAYATLLSEESLAQELESRTSASITPVTGVYGDVEEAIRQSLAHDDKAREAADLDLALRLAITEEEVDQLSLERDDFPELHKTNKRSKA